MITIDMDDLSTATVTQPSDDYGGKTSRASSTRVLRSSVQLVSSGVQIIHRYGIL
jgi:hypothetical protein